MFHTWQGYKLRFRPKNPIFHSLIGFYFVSFFFEHPVFIILFPLNQNEAQKNMLIRGMDITLKTGPLSGMQVFKC